LYTSTSKAIASTSIFGVAGGGGGEVITVVRHTISVLNPIPKKHPVSLWKQQGRHNACSFVPDRV